MPSSPEPIGRTLAELITLRGWARASASEELAALWAEVAGAEVAEHTRVGAIKRGILQVNVDNSALLAQLRGFRKDELLEALNERHPDLRLRDLRFRLQS